MSTEATIILSFIAVAALTIAAILLERRKDRILADAPACKDCAHAAYLSTHNLNDRHEYGLKWPSEDGYYCRLSEFRASSGGVAVTGYDKKRMMKCEDVRKEWAGCGLRGRLFEVKP